jgi:ATP-dependent DNA ligase
VKLLDYVGAGARLEVERALALDPDRWAWMPKVDGVYARVSLDGRGRIATVVGRNGAPIAEARDLIGIHAGVDDSVLAGELEAHTEAGNRAAAARGWRALHLFDCTRYGGRDVSREPFAERYRLLHRAQALLEQDNASRARTWSEDGTGRAHDAGGRFCRAIPRDLRRLPIVPLARGAAGGRALWSSFVERKGGEGVVAVRLDALAGARGAKRKVKASDTLDCVVATVDAGAARLTWRGLSFVVSARGAIAVELIPGDVVEVACDGWYEASATPRFARIVRRRDDLSSRSVA